MPLATSCPPGPKNNPFWQKSFHEIDLSSGRPRIRFLTCFYTIFFAPSAYLFYYLPPLTMTMTYKSFFAPSAHLFSYTRPLILTLTTTLKHFLCAFGALVFLHSPIDIDTDNDPNKFSLRLRRTYFLTLAH